MVTDRGQYPKTAPLLRNSPQARFQKISAWIGASQVRGYGLAVLCTVLAYLLRNAVEAMQAVEQRDLGVKVALAEDNTAEIAICDTGPGLAPEVAARLFQPFVTTKKSGMGVGLSICQSIMQTHSGRIWVTTNEGPGITFHLSLPAAGADA